MELTRRYAGKDFKDLGAKHFKAPGRRKEDAAHHYSSGDPPCSTLSIIYPLANLAFALPDRYESTRDAVANLLRRVTSQHD